MSKNKSFRQTSIPQVSKSGAPMKYYVISADGKETKVTRDTCLAPPEAPDGECPQRWFVDEESGLVARLPRNEQSDAIARENMRSVWREAKYQERRHACQYKNTVKCDGWRPTEGGERECDSCTRRFTSRTIRLDSLFGPHSDSDSAARFEPADPFDMAGFIEDAALLDTLGAALARLDQESYSLIKDIFVHCKTERELASQLGLNQPKSVNKRKQRILEMLRKDEDLKNFFD